MYYVLKDGCLVGSSANEQNALDLVKMLQEQETKSAGLPWLLPTFSIINGEQTFIKYPDNKRKR